MTRQSFSQPPRPGKRKIDAADFLAQTPRMAKKVEAKSATETQRRRDAAEKISLARRTGEGRGEGDGGRPQDLCASVPLWQKPSSLLDTRVVYCGDNLEQPGRMQNEKGRMMKPAYSTILHSSFILLNFPVPASHYVKVMLDQVFKLKNQIPLAINNQL